MKFINFVTQLENAGAQKIALSLTKEFNRKGFNGTTCFLYRKTNSSDANSDTHIICAERPSGPVSLIKLLFKIIRYIRSNRPDVIIAHTHYSNIIVLPLAWLCGISIRIAVHHNPRFSFPLLVKPIDAAWGGLGVYSAAICVSNSTLTSFEGKVSHRYIKKMKMIYNGVESMQCNLTRQDSRKLLKIKSEEFVVGMLGRLAPQKNNALAIKALRDVQDVHLILAGSGPLEKHLNDLVNEYGLGSRVSFLGEISREQVPIFLRACNVICMPSLHEACSIAIVEAMQLGTPVIVSDIPSLVEIVGEGERAAGLVFRSEDPGELARAITFALQNPDSMSELSKRGIQRGSQFDFESMCNAYMDLILILAQVPCCEKQNTRFGGQ